MSRRTKPPGPGPGPDLDPAPAPPPAGEAAQPKGESNGTPAQTPSDAEAPEQARGYGTDLANKGWTIQSVVHQGQSIFTALDSCIQDWHNMDWSQRVYHQAKHRFDANGILSIKANELTGPDPLLRRAIRTSSLHPNGYPLPGGPIAGANERLRQILQKTRVTIDYDSQNDTTLVHTGPDGSIIVTNETGWSTATVENLREYRLSELQACPWEPHGPHGPDAPGPMPDWAHPTSNLPLPSTTTHGRGSRDTGP